MDRGNGNFSQIEKAIGYTKMVGANGRQKRKERTIDEDGRKD